MDDDLTPEDREFIDAQAALVAAQDRLTAACASLRGRRRSWAHIATLVRPVPVSRQAVWERFHDVPGMP